MAALTTALNTEFTPAAGDFRIQVIVGRVRLMSRPAGVTDFAEECALQAVDTRLVYNAISGTVYKFVGDYGAGQGNPSARADQ